MIPEFNIGETVFYLGQANKHDTKSKATVFKGEVEGITKTRQSDDVPSYIYYTIRTNNNNTEGMKGNRLKRDKREFDGEVEKANECLSYLQENFYRNQF